MNERIEAAFDGPFLVAAQHPALRHAIRRAVGRREIERFLPGLYIRPGTTLAWRERVTALRLAVPDAVITGVAAAKLTFWPELDDPQVVEAVAELRPREGYAFSRRRVPRSHRRTLDDGTWVTSRPRTALDLVATLGGSAIDRALRSGMDLADLRRVTRDLAGGRGGRKRTRLVEESRDRPWSPAERAGHAALHAATIEGWKANLKLSFGSSTYALDIAFPALRLAVEIDGRSYHENDGSFARDRRRDRVLAEHGWQTIRFTAAEVLGDPVEFVRSVCAVLDARARLLGLT